VPLGNLRVEDLIEPRNFIRFGREPHAVDILPGIDGVDFDKAWERRIEEVIDAQTGITAFFISNDDLIASKIAAGRPQDLADVAALRDAAESQKDKSAGKSQRAKPKRSP
jgi:Nucleotidyltransferase of unknown function (DUF6036)